MSRICPETGNSTHCTEDCKYCARDIWDELCARAGKAEMVTQDAIINVFGENAFNMLRKYGYIEHCRVDELGRHWYAI
jgi:hypothetical protein